MAVLHITEAEVVRDPSAVFNQVRAGSEVVIEDGGSPIMYLTPALDGASEAEAGHDAWFRAEVRKGLDSDPANDLDEDAAKAHFAARRGILLDALGEVE